jgi:hypothetical protein
MTTAPRTGKYTKCHRARHGQTGSLGTGATRARTMAAFGICRQHVNDRNEGALLTGGSYTAERQLLL